MSNFQTILVAIFLSFFVFAVLIFSGLIKIGGVNKTTDKPVGKVVIWGTLPNSVFTKTIEKINTDNRDLSLSYIRKEKSSFQQELIEAFAKGKGPDLFIVSTDMIQDNLDFIYTTPYNNYPEKTFKESFIDGADIYLGKDGVLGFPFLVDPLVLYYNKDILSNEGLVNPPQTWDELFGLNSSLTKRDNAGTINQSMIALGQFANINNGKDLLATLLIQNSNPIVKKDPATSVYVSALTDNPLNLSITPIEAVLKFFIEFSNPSSTAYSWNRSLPDSKDMFTGGKLAFYIGRASELFSIESVNPNLSFDVTQIPQIKNSNKRTYGEIYSLVINKKSANLTSAFKVANTLAFGENAQNLSIAASLPPASRNLLQGKPSDPYLHTFFSSAVISKSWVDPDDEQTDFLFEELIENILSNRMSMSDAIGKANGQLQILIKK